LPTDGTTQYPYTATGAFASPADEPFLETLTLLGYLAASTALHQKSFLHRIFRGKNGSLWSRKSLQNEATKALLTDGLAY
jgi:hypothetical protein